MKIQTNSRYTNAGQGVKCCEFDQGIYEAVVATNQPDYEKEGKVFISNAYGNSILLTKEDYTLVEVLEQIEED